MYYCMKIYILASLFLVSGREHNSDIWSMVFSDANPIQFWLVECDTYNQHVNEGVFSRCFEQPWKCSDEIFTQFTDTDEGSPAVGANYALSIRNESGTELLSLPFDKSEPLSLASLPEGENSGSGTDWTIDADPNVSTSGISKVFRLPITSAKAGIEYEFHYKIHNQGSLAYNGSIFIQLYDSSMNILDELELTITSGIAADFEATITLTGDSDPAYIGVVSDPTSGSVQTRIDELYLNAEGDDTFVYDLSFIPSDLSPEICDEKVQFVVVNTDTEEDVAKSDAHDIATEQPNTILINYSNDYNYAGLVYADGQQFNLRVPAIFFHQRFPTQEEVMQLSSSLVSLNSTIRRQRLMDTDYMPYYMHEKIALVLAHQTVNIYNKLWAKEEAYEIADGNRMYPEKKAKVWLSEKTFLQRNVL